MSKPFLCNTALMPDSCDVGTGIAFLIYTSPELPDNIGLASSWYLLSALLNISVTGLIVGRLIITRRRLTNTVPLADVKMYSGAISILVESALPFCLVSIIAAILSLPYINLPATANYFTTLWVALSVCVFLSVGCAATLLTQQRIICSHSALS
jgi:hypothetical protein